MSHNAPRAREVKTPDAPSTPIKVAGIAIRLETQFRGGVLAVSILALILTLLLPGVTLMVTVAALLAVGLNKIVRRMTRFGISRSIASGILVGSTTLIIVGALSALAPLFASNLSAFAEAAPGIVDSVSTRLRNWANALGLRFAPSASAPSIGSALQQGAAPVARVVTQSLNALMLLALVPFVTYFMLADAPQTLRRMRRLVPPRQKRGWLMLATKLRRRLGGYIRGLGLIALIQAALMATMLGLLGLNFGVVIGVLAGFSSIVPVLGNLTMFVVALVVAIAQFDTSLPIVGVIVAFALAQLLETAILQPLLMGDAIAVSPLAMILTLIAAGSLFGIIGAIVAVPAVAAAAVVFEVLRNPPVSRTSAR